MDGGARKTGTSTSNLEWSTATLIENSPANAQGNLRAITLSVADAVVYMDGVRFNRRQEQPRWLDSYQHPGSFVHARFQPTDQNDPGTPKYPLFCIATSPSTVLSKSVSLDASIIELLVDTQGPDDFSVKLAATAPGALIEVSQVIGRGYGSIFDENIGLMSSMEEKQDLLLVASGVAGIAAIRAVLDWVPVQAHATEQKVTLVYEAESPRSAAYVASWDEWRNAGVNLVPVFKEDNNEDLVPLMAALIERPNGLAGLLGGADLGKVSVLLSVAKGIRSAALSKLMINEGVRPECMLFCDFYGKPNV